MIDKFFYNFFSAVDNMFSWLETYSVKFTSWLWQSRVKLLRKKRKSGFLTPSINLNFFDTKISQSTSFPYYFNLSQDKELTFTPTINYGGGIDSSQRFEFDYNQILSGGILETQLTFDTTFENQNSEKWLREGSLINNYKQNINTNR